MIFLFIDISSIYREFILDFHVSLWEPKPQVDYFQDSELARMLFDEQIFNFWLPRSPVGINN